MSEIETQAETTPQPLPTLKEIITWADDQDVSLSPGEADLIQRALIPGQNYQERVEEILDDEDELASITEDAVETPGDVLYDGDLEFDQFNHVRDRIGDDIDSEIWDRAQEILLKRGHEFVHLCELEDWTDAYADASEEMKPEDEDEDESEEDDDSEE